MISIEEQILKHPPQQKSISASETNAAFGWRDMVGWEPKRSSGGIHIFKQNIDIVSPDQEK